MAPPLRQALASELVAIFSGGAAELRLDLPDSWVIFWKERTDESRLLLAHPRDGEWVATAALERGHGLELVRLLREAAPGTEIAVGEISSGVGRISSISNVEIVLSIEA
jgi:hypothetical protein